LETKRKSDENCPTEGKSKDILKEEELKDIFLTSEILLFILFSSFCWYVQLSLIR